MSLAVEIKKPSLTIQIPQDKSDLEGVDIIKRTISAYLRIKTCLFIAESAGNRPFFEKIVHFQTIVEQHLAYGFSQKVMKPCLNMIDQGSLFDKSIKIVSIASVITVLGYIFLLHPKDQDLSFDEKFFVFSGIGLNVILKAIHGFCSTAPLQRCHIASGASKGLDVLAHQIYEFDVIFKICASAFLWYFLSNNAPDFAKQLYLGQASRQDLISLVLIFSCFFSDRFVVLLKDLSCFFSVIAAFSQLAIIKEPILTGGHDLLIDEYKEFIQKQLLALKKQKSKEFKKLEIDLERQRLTIKEHERYIEEAQARIANISLELHKILQRPLEDYLTAQESRSSPVTCVRHKSINDCDLQRRKDIEFESVVRRLEEQKKRFTHLNIRYMQLSTQLKTTEIQIKNYLKHNPKDKSLNSDEQILHRYLPFFTQQTTIRKQYFLQNRDSRQHMPVQPGEHVSISFREADLSLEARKTFQIMQKALLRFAVHMVTAPITMICINILVPLTTEVLISVCPQENKPFFSQVISVINLWSGVSLGLQFLKSYKLESEQVVAPHVIKRKAIERIFSENSYFKKLEKALFSEKLEALVSSLNSYQGSCFEQLHECLACMLEMMVVTDVLDEKEARMCHNYLSQLSMLLSRPSRSAIEASHQAWYHHQLKKLIQFYLEKQAAS